jgi:hypothetical protein
MMAVYLNVVKGFVPQAWLPMYDAGAAGGLGACGDGRVLAFGGEPCVPVEVFLGRDQIVLHGALRWHHARVVEAHEAIAPATQLFMLHAPEASDRLFEPTRKGGEHAQGDLDLASDETAVELDVE